MTVKVLGEIFNTKKVKFQRIQSLIARILTVSPEFYYSLMLKFGKEWH